MSPFDLHFILFQVYSHSFLHNFKSHATSLFSFFQPTIIGPNFFQYRDLTNPIAFPSTALKFTEMLF